MAELTPAPLGNLVRRMLRQLEGEEKIFDLPLRKLWQGSPDLDTSVSFHGRRAANPLGPAAGPHVQMAQNIVRAWLAGSLKRGDKCGSISSRPFNHGLVLIRQVP